MKEPLHRVAWQLIDRCTRDASEIGDTSADSLAGDAAAQHVVTSVTISHANYLFQSAGARAFDSRRRHNSLKFDRDAAIVSIARIPDMSESIETLRQKMEAAVEALDFEEARRCRDQINLIRGGATAKDAAEADASGLERQQPGAMGLGTSQQRMTPPPGWKAPPKPDPMTKGRSNRGAQKRGR